eukprot:GILI01026543.1.p1 GENE.GILI01026543.1~~GILI01026543.1.p1  ORF type:complete len:141 (-),score=19.28 GILI01026543.1:149-571(-)
MVFKKVTNTLITKPWGNLVARSEAKVAAMTGPLKANIDASNASGDDLTAKLWSEYSSNQSHMWDWRKNRIHDEFAVLRSGEVNLATAGRKEFIQFLRFGTRALVAFLVGVMVGRGQIFPILPGDSPFRKQLALQSIGDQK